MEHIDPNLIKTIFIDSLFKDEEIEDGKVPDKAVLVYGIVDRIGFNPDRLETHRSVVLECLKLLPVEFRKTGGGGWTFLNACMEVGGAQWTGLHQRMEQLFMLAIGLGLARWQMREMQSVLPGGMPFVQIEL